jgi:hypothetical protein
MIFIDIRCLAPNYMAQKIPLLKPVLAYPNRVIAQLCQQINQQRAILEQVKSVLPKELASHALHCVCNNKKLFVYTDSASWASQLRFHSSAMLAACGQAAATSASVLQVKVMNPPAFAVPNPKFQPTIPSNIVADEIRHQSLMVSDPQLSEALARLSATLARLHARQ